MLKIVTKDYIRIPKQEYAQLKHLQRRFEDFLAYTEHIQDIREAREDIRAGRTMSQEQLFKKLGFK